MKLSRHPSLTWTLSSTLVLALTFGLTMFSGSAAAPGSTPPNGNIIPTFNAINTTSDITAGGYVYVGNGIKPKTGAGLTLDADKVNFTKDIEVAGGGIISKVLQVIGSIKGNGGSPLLLDSDAVVSGNLNIKGGLGGGINIDANNITQKTGGVIHIGPGMLDVTGKLNAPMGASLGTTDVVSLNAFGKGLFGSFESTGAALITGLLTADGGVKTNTISSTGLTPDGLSSLPISINNLIISKPVIASKPISLSAYVDAANGTKLRSDILSFGFGGSGILIKKGPNTNNTGSLTADGNIKGGQLISNGATIGGIYTDGLSPTGSVDPSYQLALTSGTTTVNGSQFTLATGTEFNSDFLNTYSSPTKSLFTGTVGVGGHLSAGSIGNFTLHSFLNNNGGGKITVTPGNSGSSSILSCSAAEVMTSCSLYSAKPTVTSSVMMEIIYDAGKPIWKCSVNGFNAGSEDADYYASGVCFDPNG